MKYSCLTPAAAGWPDPLMLICCLAHLSADKLMTLRCFVCAGATAAAAAADGMDTSDVVAGGRKKRKAKQRGLQIQTATMWVTLRRGGGGGQTDAAYQGQPMSLQLLCFAGQ
jgi:hypothetical protein